MYSKSTIRLACCLAAALGTCAALEACVGDEGLTKLDVIANSPDMRAEEPDLAELWAQELCAPECNGDECGDDGCGGSCGECDDGLTCTADSCDEGKCQSTLMNSHCLLGSSCKSAGDHAPGNPCVACDPLQSTGSWTTIEDGVGCADGYVCYQGACCAALGHCQGRECGDDGCGGNCGVCPEGLDCVDSLCIYVPKCGNGVCEDDEDCSTCFPDCSCVTQGFVKTTAGGFWMGSPSGKGESCPEGYAGGGCAGDGTGATIEEPGRNLDEQLHHVLLTRNFEIQNHEVTQGEWEAVFYGWNPSYFGPDGLSYDHGDDCPVENISWYDALAFANWKSVEAGLEPCYLFSSVLCEGNSGPSDGTDYGFCLNPTQGGIYSAEVTLAVGQGSPYDCTGYRLPTEAEWEYAARAGTLTAYHNGMGWDEEDEICPVEPYHLTEIAWYCGNEGGPSGEKGTKTVGSKEENQWGLHDMSGNVWEWVWDKSCNSLAGPALDPDGSGCESAHRSVRGGSWLGTAGFCRSANRYALLPGDREKDLGFRLARSF